MSKQIKEPKAPFNFKKLKIRVAKGFTYIGLFLTSGYGLRKMFEAMPETVAYVVTVVLVLTALFVLSLDEK